MLELDNDISKALSSSSLSYKLLVKFEFTELTVGVTNAPQDITEDDVLYSADGGLKRLTPPKVEAGVSRDIFGVTLTDADFYFRDILTVESTGTPVVIHMYVETVNGFTAIQIYSGVLSSFNSKIEGDEHMLDLQCVGPITKLQQLTNRSTTDASQRKEYPNDAAFEKVFDSENTATKKWGGNG